VRDFAIAQGRAWRLTVWLERNGGFDARILPLSTEGVAEELVLSRVR
jgi:hypothetical protein